MGRIKILQAACLYLPVLFKAENLVISSIAGPEITSFGIVRFDHISVCIITEQAGIPHSAGFELAVLQVQVQVQKTAALQLDATVNLVKNAAVSRQRIVR
jgi:hypothetical protein